MFLFHSFMKKKSIIQGMREVAEKNQFNAELKRRSNSVESTI